MDRSGNSELLDETVASFNGKLYFKRNSETIELKGRKRYVKLENDEIVVFKRKRENSIKESIKVKDIELVEITGPPGAASPKCLVIVVNNVKTCAFCHEDQSYIRAFTVAIIRSVLGSGKNQKARIHINGIQANISSSSESVMKELHAVLDSRPVDTSDVQQLNERNLTAAMFAITAAATILRNPLYGKSTPLSYIQDDTNRAVNDASSPLQSPPLSQRLSDSNVTNNISSTGTQNVYMGQCIRTTASDELGHLEGMSNGGGGVQIVTTDDMEIRTHSTYSHITDSLRISSVSRITANVCGVLQI